MDKPPIRIPVSRPSIYYQSSVEESAVEQVIHSGQITHGPTVLQFEHDFSKYLGVPYAIACSSGTAALHLALAACGITYGDEVIVPTVSFVATANAVSYCGAKPVLVDIDSVTWGIGTHYIESKITPRTKAIVAVHLYGVPCDMVALRAIADRHNLYLIEDAAEGLGGSDADGAPLGSIGDLGTFSFYGNKIITCFPPETSILVKPAPGKGKSRVRRIDQIRVGDEVLSFDESTHQKSYKPVTAVQRSSARSLVVVKFSNGNSLRVTKDHPVYTTNRGWVDAGSLFQGDVAVQYIYRGLRNIERPVTWSDERKSEHSKKIAEAHRAGSYDASGDYGRRGPKITKALKGKKRTSEYRAACSARMKKRFMDPAEVRKHSESGRARFHRPGELEKHRIRSIASLSRPEVRQRISAGVRRAMQTEQYWESYHRGLQAKKNKAEAKLEKILDAALPGQFAFNGDGSYGVRIGNFIPDFVHMGGSNKLIELFGRRWHRAEEESSKRGRYAELGYDSLVIWDDELKDRDAVTEKVVSFAHNPGTKLVVVESVREEDYDGDVYNLTVADTHTYFARGILVHNCGEGGMVVTKRAHLADRVRHLRGQAQSPDRRFYHTEVGFNYRMTEMQAALGIEQLALIDEFIFWRSDVCNQYCVQLGDLAYCPYKNAKGKLIHPAPWLFTVAFDYASTRERVEKALTEAGIETRPMFVPMHRLPMYSANPLDFPNAEFYHPRSLSLPTYVGLKDEEVEEICSIIQSAC